MRRTPTSQQAQMLDTPTFYLLWIAFAFGTTAGQMTISQLVPFARTAGLGATVATYSLIVTSFGNAGGRILSGWMSDTIGRLRTLQMMVFLSAIAMPALFLLRTEVVPFFVLIFLVYWCYGTQLSLFASTTADFYGTRNLGIELRCALHGVGRRWHPGTGRRRTDLRPVRRLSLRVLLGSCVRGDCLRRVAQRKAARASASKRGAVHAGAGHWPASTSHSLSQPFSVLVHPNLRGGHGR